MKRILFSIILIIIISLPSFCYNYVDSDGLVYWLDSYYGVSATLIGCQDKSVKTITVPSSIEIGRTVPVKYIGSNAISNDLNDLYELEELNLPESILSIDAGFKNCTSLKQLKVPASIRSIGSNCFIGCTNLSEFIVSEMNEYYSSIEGVLFNKDGSILYRYPPGRDNEEYFIPDNVNEIANYAFNDIKPVVKTIKFSKTVQKIGYSSFASLTSLESIELPNSLNSIGGFAFEGCVSLSSLYLPASINFIYSDCFRECKALKKVVIDADLNELSEWVFRDCVALTDVEINSPSLTTIKNSFYGCLNLKNIKLPESLISLESNAFEDCKKLEKIDIPINVSILYPSAFYGCESLKEVNIQQGNENYTSKEGVVYNKDLSELIFFPQSNSVIFEIPESVDRIGKEAFYYNQKITHIFPNNPNKPEYLPETHIIIFNPHITKIPNYAFYACKNLVEVDLPNTITNIGEGAFKFCANLKSLHLSEGLKEIKGDNLSLVSNLDSLILPPLLNEIPPYFCDTDVDVLFAPYEKPIEAYDNSFTQKNYENTILYVPIGSKERYESTKGWENFKNIIEFDYITASSIEIEKKDYFGEPNIPIQLSANLSPENVFFKHVQWGCNQSESYDLIGENNGIFVSPSKGIYSVYAYPVYGSKISAECTVYIGYSHPERISLNETNITLHLGETSIITATVYPENAYYEKVIWTSENPDIAIIDSEGMIFPVGYGITNIKATIEGTDIEAECHVSVIPIEVNQILLNIENVELCIGDRIHLEATVLPEQAESKTIIWSSSDENIATVSETGLVSAISVGTVSIIATCGEVSASCKVTVNPILAESVVLNLEAAELNIAETIQLEATVLPEDTTDKTVIWNSSDESVATVSEEGLVTGIAEGKTIITATCGEATAACEITVLDDAGVEGILANPDSKISIYTTDGILIKKDCKVEDLKTLNKGIYIIVSGKDRYKISL